MDFSELRPAGVKHYQNVNLFLSGNIDTDTGPSTGLPELNSLDSA